MQASKGVTDKTAHSVLSPRGQTNSFFGGFIICFSIIRNYSNKTQTIQCQLCLCQQVIPKMYRLKILMGITSIKLCCKASGPFHTIYDDDSVYF